ncbi:MAG: ubiquinone/menaquinone biosynthesis methyltransferase [Gemmatimonadaceae bacterium]|nr:ubiquinone/menaquinone biosynthesis methyltransferase [Gemmatimonadaceae bacterium]
MPSVLTEEAVSIAAAAGSREKRAYVRQIFSEIAPRYDLLNHLLSFNIDRMWRNRAIGVLDPSAFDGIYLDLCAGTLDVSRQMTGWGNFRGRVVSADFAEPMLRAGIEKARGRPINPVTADALDLPLADASIDGAIVAFGIRNVASLDSGLGEVYRVLKPGCRFVILEFSTPRFAPVRWLYHLYFHQVLPLVGGLISGHATAYSYLPRSVANFPVQEDLAERMRRAGFTAVSWKSLTFGIAAIHQGVRA